MSQAFSARESGCSFCSMRSSSLGLAALPNTLRVSCCREKPLMRVSIGLRQSLPEAGAVGGQGVASAPGPIQGPSHGDAVVAVLGKENWKTSLPDPQLVLGRLGVPGGGWCLALEAPWRHNSSGCSSRLGLLGAELKASPAAWFTRRTQCPSAGPAFGYRTLQQQSLITMLPTQEHHQPLLALPLPCPSLVQNWKS